MLATQAVATQFMEYVSIHGKSYITLAEFQARQALYADTDALIKAHNATDSTFELGHNKFSDYTEAERKAMTGRKGNPTYVEPTYLEPTNASEVDWRTKGAVTAVKDQGQCGSCWAFSSTGALEGSNFIISGKMLSFSEQQLVDCATQAAGYGNNGCNGGLQQYAFHYYQYYEAEVEAKYAYTGKDGTCTYSSGDISGVNVAYYETATADNAEQMKAAVAKQPVSVSIEADRPVFQQYKNGIFDSTACGDQLDHATLVVGYGSENGTEYWIMKNSWASTWGEDGYMRLAIKETGSGNCGIQHEPIYPTAGEN